MLTLECICGRFLSKETGDSKEIKGRPLCIRSIPLHWCLFEEGRSSIECRTQHIAIVRLTNVKKF